jgi:hypothetical protein
MNSPKVVLSLGAILIFSVLMTACGGGGSTPKPPAGAPTIQTVILPQGAVNVAYGVGGLGAVLSATGGTGTYTWGIASGSLPPGLTLNPTTAVISGTPTALGNYNFTAQVTDSASMTATKALSIYIEGVVSITPMALPSGTPNVPYTNSNGTPVQLMATGGLAPYVWCAVENGGTCDTGTGGALPPGLSLSSSGVISGTPTTPGFPTAFTVKVTDSETSPGVPAVGTASFSITIMSITTTSLPSGYLSTAYSGTLIVAGGVQPYTWTATNLPPGLALDPTTCAGSKGPMCTIKGTPTTPGAYPMTVTVTDGEKPTPAAATASLTINVFQSQLTITTTTLPPGIVGLAYSAPLGATGGTPPYTWSLTSGTLPPGLMLDGNTGVISGTPTTASSYGFTLQVADSGMPQQAVSGTFNILINPAITNANFCVNCVFTFSGYNNGTPVMMAGSFVTDGKGNITSGVLDYNDGTGETPSNNPTPQTIVPGAGSVYSITPNGLGTMTITTNLAVFQFAIVVKGDGSGRLIQSDPANKQSYGSGAILTNTPLGTGEKFPLCGSHLALGFFGFDSNLTTRYAGAGVFQFDPYTCVDAENGLLDTDDGGSLASPTFTGAFNQLNNPTSRGIAGLTLTPGGRHFYAFYLVSSSDRKTNQLYWMATEPVSQPANLTLWTAFQQASPPLGWDNTYLTGTTVPELNALDTNGAVDVTAGLFVGKGVSGNTCQGGKSDPATFNYDENQGGTSSLQQTSSGTYCVDKTTGRVTLTPFSSGPFVTPPVFYMVKGGQAFVVGTDPAVTSGFLEQQTGSPFTNGSVAGPYVGGTVAPITSAVTNAANWLFADAAGNINGSGNTSGPGGPQQQKFNYTYSVDGTGRTVVQQNGSPIGVLYVVSPQKFVMLPTTADPSPALSVFTQ